MREKVKKGVLLPLLALVTVLSLAFGLTGLKGARAAEADGPTVLADFETGDEADWFTEPLVKMVNGITKTADNVEYGSSIDEGRLTYQIVPEDYDAANFGATPATGTNKAALLYMTNWGLRSTLIPFAEPYTVTPGTELSFRIKIHTPPGSKDWIVVFTASDGTNDMFEGYRISENLAQDTWVTVQLNSTELNGLVDENGQLSGVTVGLFATYGGGAPYDGGNGPMNVMLDDFVAREGAIEFAAPEGALLTEGVESDLVVGKPVLTKVNGQINMDTPGKLYDWYKSGPQNYAFEENVAGALDGNALRLNICHWRTGGLRMDFEKSVDLAEISALKLRMFFHLSQDIPYGGTIYLFSADSQGDLGLCVPLPRNAAQDEWVEIEIKGAELALLADAEGKIPGMQIGYNIHDGSGNNYLNWAGYLYLDQIAYARPATVTFDDGTAETKTTATTTEAVEKPVSPERAGKVFAGWYDGDERYDFTQPLLAEELELTAKWLDAAAAPADAYGLYVGDAGNLMLYPEGTAFLAGTLDDGTKLSFAADGKLIFDNADGTFEGTLSGDAVIFAGAAYTFADCVTVTYEDRDAVYVRYCLPGGTAESLEIVRPGYTFEGWFSGENEFDFSTALSADLTLTAKWGYELEEATDWRFATYYAEGVKLILKSDGTAKLVRDGSTTEADWFVLTTSALVLETEEGVIEGVVGQYAITLEGKELVRLRQFHASFELNGGTGEIERQTFRPESGSEYLVTRPEDPVKEGYVFAGWKTKDGADFDFDTVLTESVTLYASWTSADGSVPQAPSGCNGKGASAAACVTLLGAAVAMLGRRKF